MPLKLRHVGRRKGLSWAGPQFFVCQCPILPQAAAQPKGQRLPVPLNGQKWKKGLYGEYENPILSSIRIEEGFGLGAPWVITKNICWAGDCGWTCNHSTLYCCAPASASIQCHWSLLGSLMASGIQPTSCEPRLFFIFFYMPPMRTSSHNTTGLSTTYISC